MAKQRLVDFRGGINQKISPHMIGDSQGQEAQDVDSSSVRLEGRLLIDTSEKAEGSYFYESGNLSSNTFEGRWVSIYPEDSSTYLDGATDFALWNKDLYVAYGEDSVNGELQVYRDGSSTATQVNFDEPGTSSYTTYDADSTSEFLAPYSANDNSEVLIASVTGQSYVPPQTGIYPVTQQAGTGEALISAFDPVYSATSPLYNSTHSRNTYTKNNTTYYENPSTYRLQQNTGGSAAYTVNLSTSTVGDFDPVFSPSSLFYDTRSFSGVDTQTFNTYIRNSTTYYVPTSNNTNLGVSTTEFYTQSGGTQSATISLSLSTYSDSGFNPAYTNLNATFNDRTLRPYTGIEDYTFSHTFSRSGVTYYYASTANSTLSVEAGKFYTQSGGTQSGTVNLSITTYSDSGFNPAYVNTNSTFNDFLQAGRNVSPIVNYSFDLFTHTVNGVTTTYYYAPSDNTTLGVSSGSFYTRSGTGTTTSSPETISYNWERHTLASYPYNSNSSDNQWVHYPQNANNFFFIDVAGTRQFVIGNSYSTTSGRAAVSNPSNYSSLQVTTNTGDTFEQQSNGDLLKSGTTSTYLLTADIPNIIHVRFTPVAGNSQNLLTDTKQFYRSGSGTFTSSGYIYSFEEKDDSYGTGVWRDQQSNALQVLEDVTASNSSSYTLTGYEYDIPSTSVTPSQRDPTNVSRTNNVIQSFSYSTTRTQTSTNSENITYEWSRTLLNTYNYAYANRWNTSWNGYQWSWEIDWVANNKNFEAFYIDVNSYVGNNIWKSDSSSFFLNISHQSISFGGTTLGVAGIPSGHVLTHAGSFCELTLTNGDVFTLQSDRSFRRNGSTATNGSDRLYMLTSESLANGGNGNPHDIEIIRIKHANGDGRITIGQYRVNFNSYSLSGTSLWQYEFFEMDEVEGTGVFKDSSQNTLLTLNNVWDTYTTSAVSGAWTYNIPATSSSPSSSSPSGISRTAGGIQSFSIATTRTEPVSTPVNYTYSLHTDSYTGQVPVNYTYSVHTDSYVGTVPSNYTYSQFTPYSQSFPATFTYQDITDTVPGQTGVPDTPAFTYDDARTKLYLLYSSSNDVGNETTDNAQGYNWLQQGRDFSLADEGYYLRTLREDVSGGTGLPVVSGDKTLATLASGSSHVFGLSLDSTPQRLNFSIVQPTDVTNPAFKGYKLERIDNESSVDLGYIAPDSNVSFTYNTSTKAVTITGLGTTSSDNYRLKFAAYQDTQVRTTLNSGTAVTAKSNMSGVLFNGNDTFTIQLIDGTDTRFRAADFWLEKKVIEGTSSTNDDIYAVIRCFDLFDRNSNAVQSGVITGVCDFLDAFPNGLSSGGLSSGATQSGVPTYLKFLKEANNFFFAVGTESTPDNRYGSANNKADSFLFVSEYNNPRSWPLTGYVEFDASITGLASYPGELIAWTPSGTFRVTGSRYDQMRKSRLATTEGMPIGHHRSIAQVGRYLVWVSQSGICFYDGDKVTNLTRGRFPTWSMQGNGLHAGQYDDTYYVVDSTETGYAVDFALEGFPVTEIDLTEGSSTTPSNASGDTLPPVLVYKPSENKLYSRRGVIEGSQNRGLWSYKTRAFDGGSFGSLKLVRNVTLNGTGSGQVQVYLDGKPAFVDSNGASSPKTVNITSSIRTEPARIYLPAASADTQYGLNMADVWSVEIINWDGKIDWIDTEYEIISGA